MADLNRALADAESDYRIAMREAKARLDRAWLVAYAEFNRAELAATRARDAARATARASAERKRNAWRSLDDAGTADLLDEYRRYAFLLNPAMVRFRSRADIESAQWHTRVIGSILRRRGVRALDIPETLAS
jgi:hypothetical protein